MADAVKDELLLLCCNEVLGIRNIASSLANPRKLLVSTSYQAQLSARLRWPQGQNQPYI